MKNYVLDTSAILTLFYEESGIEILNNLFDDKSNHFIISFLTPYEIYYTTLRRHSKYAANSLLRLTFQMGVEIDYKNDLSEIISSGIIKGTFLLSAIDAWIASLAIRRNAILVHKDPDFETLKDQIELISLPYK